MTHRIQIQQGRGWWGLVFAFSLLAGCATTSRLKVGRVAGGEVVEAEGLAPYNAGDLPGTKAASRTDAQRNALEKVVGVYISAKTRVEKAMLVESKILANTSGYISKYDILRETREGSFYKTRIRALVLFQKLGEDLENLGLLTTKVGNPRVAVLLEENIDGNPSESPDAANALSAALISRGFLVVDRSALAGAAAQSIISAVEKGDTQGIKDLGREIHAEVVLVGQGQASELQNIKELGGMISYRARISLQALRSASGQVLSALSQEASGLNVNKPLAAAKALETAAQLAGEKMAGQLLKALQYQTVELQVHNIKDLDQLKKLQDRLNSEPEVKGVYLRNFSQGEANLSVSGDGVSGEKIGAFLSKDQGLQMNNISPAGLDLAFKE